MGKNRRNKVKNGVAMISGVKPQSYMAPNPLTGTGLQNPTSPLQANAANPQVVRRNLANYIAPNQLERLRASVRDWRDAVREAETAYHPQRVKMQRMFRDTILNGHIGACLKKRDRLTMLRQFGFGTGTGDEFVENKELTEMFKTKWFYGFMKYVLAANYYGYSLISLGAIVESSLKNVKLIERWHVSPDRFNVTSYLYATGGKSFLDADVVDWHVYVDTMSEDGQSPCGYGLLYTVAIYEILMRNNLGYNADFTERFSMPYVVAKTTKTDESERGELENAVSNMGSAGYAITDPDDEIEFLEAALAGTGWNGYDNLETRLQKICSKVILGHADALDSTPGKLGAGQDGEESPVNKALSEVQSEDGRTFEQVVNTELIPKLRKLGLPFPEGIRFQFRNDDEKEEFRRKEDESNKTTAEIVKTFGDAGLDVDEKWITDRTGIPITKKPEPEPIDPGLEGESGLNPKIKNKLVDLYS